jgi:hypothetical protein
MFLPDDIFDIIYRRVFYLKHDVSETGIFLRPDVEPIQLDQTDRASHCLRTAATTPKPTQHKPPTRANISTPGISIHAGPNPYI